MGKDWSRNVTAGSALLLITVVALAILAFAPGGLELPPLWRLFEGGLSQGGNAPQTALLKGFDSHGSGALWKLQNWEMGVIAPAEGAQTPLPPGRFWQSEPLPVPPSSFFRIEVQTKGPHPVWLGGMGFNPSAVWGRYPHAAAVAGELVADDWTSWADTNDSGWTQREFFTRALSHSTMSGVRLMGEGARFRNLRVTTATDQEVGAWADLVYSREMAKLSWVPTAEVLRTCPRARKILHDGQPLRMAFLGDSIMSDLGNSTIDVLLKRRFPGSSVTIISAVGGGTGAGAWLRDAGTAWPRHDLDLNAAVIRTRPDLVIIGGISNGESWRSDIDGLVTRIRQESLAAWNSSPEILLASGAFGAGNGPPDDETGLAGLALESGCGFLPLRTITENYLAHDAASKYSRKHFYRDAIHANHRGKQLLGRILLTFLSGRPEGP